MRWSSSTRSAAAPPPSTACRSPGRRSSTCTRSTARRALFATHYHELTALAHRLPRLDNVTVRVKEWKGDVIFLHEIAPGSADRSYGIQVARLAGLPPSVVARAREVLKQLEETDRKSPAHTLIDDLPLFSAARPAEPKPKPTRWRRCSTASPPTN